jgi:cytochrome c553
MTNGLRSRARITGRAPPDAQAVQWTEAGIAKGGTRATSRFVAAAGSVLLLFKPELGLAAGDRALGEYLSSECVACHQLSGRNQGIPSIVGWPEASFIEIMNEYREKRRSNPVMQTIAGKFSNDEVAALAAYFGSVKPKN